MYSVLKKVESGVDKPTRIRYEARLSWSLLVKYLDFLVFRQLLEEKVSESGKRRFYCITDKGKEFIDVHERIDEEFSLAVS
ncbi:hypothetical protein GF319_11460 [Candidatus Bathyarchaeota archaeon]|nr:hypothetical protein [Candidatus Bathyarchaeota archaeon]